MLLIALCTTVSAAEEDVWSEPSLLSDPNMDATQCSMTPYGDGYVVSWAGESEGNREIYAIVLSEGLLPVGAVQRMTYEPGDDTEPHLFTTSSGDVWLVWSSNRYGTYDVFARTLHDGSWSQASAVVQTEADETDPTGCEEKEGLIFLAWQSGARGSYDIESRYYEAGSYLPVVPVTNDSRDDVDPYATKSATGGLWIVWASLRDGDWTAYYKTAPSFSNPSVLHANPIPPSYGNVSNPIIFWDAELVAVWSENVYDVTHAAKQDGPGTWVDVNMGQGFPETASSMAATATKDGELCIIYCSDGEGRTSSVYVIRTGRGEAQALDDAWRAIESAGVDAEERAELEALYGEMADAYYGGAFSAVTALSEEISRRISEQQQPTQTAEPPATTTPPPTTVPPTTQPPGGEPGEGRDDMVLYALAGAAAVLICIAIAAARNRTHQPGIEDADQEQAESNDEEVGQSHPEQEVPDNESAPETDEKESVLSQKEPFEIVQREPDVITPKRPYVDVHMPKPQHRDVKYIDPKYSRQYPPDSQALEEVPFVGYALAPVLRKAGIRDIGTLARASPQDIAGKTGISQSLAKTIIEEARKLLGHVSTR